MIIVRRCDFNPGDRVVTTRDGCGTVEKVSFDDQFKKWIAIIRLDDDRVISSFTWALTKECDLVGNDSEDSGETSCE